MSFALGMIETLGVIGTTEAADAMVKAAPTAAERVGELVAAHIIPNLDPQVDAVIFQKLE
jgi:microcompartment protein CcmL/EutN